MNFEIKNATLFIDKTPIEFSNLSFEDVLGEGANATVFLVWNTLINRWEALKIWKPREGFSNVDPTRFRAEIEKNAHAISPHIAQFYDANIISITDQITIYYARLEYIKGRTLNEVLRENLELVLRYSILEKTITSLLPVYEKGLYHGDLHAKNIMISDMEPTIIDFGTSIFSGKERSHERDRRMIIELCFQVLPELKKLSFLKKEELSSIDSTVLLHLLLFCMRISWDVENSPQQIHDQYTYTERAIVPAECLHEEFPFLSKTDIDAFFQTNYTFKIIETNVCEQ